MPNLTIRDLTMEFSSGGYKLRPIDSFDLDVATGDLVLLLGASGCGKTTLLSMLARLLTPTHGTITFGDIEVTSLSGPELVEYRRKTVGIVFQAFNLIPSLNARENVQIALQSAKVPRHEAKARADELLVQVGLEERITHLPADMSGGQQQRVAIARALAHDPPLVLADEPTAHLDYIQVDGVLRLLRELAQPGRVVMVATHDERLLPLADRVVELTPRAAGEARPPEPVKLAAGEVLFRQGDKGELVYVVESGEVEIFRETDDGTDERVTVIEPGGYFGELAPMFGLRRSAGARALDGPVQLTGYSLRDFRNRHTSQTLN
ncbi:MAG TPA: ATP-binding cassette domain-containing protein [Acidimicrobiia bacterium]|nr:ATP-binding cassette domain-containing protein [Acidimicrobiia bacterium]